MELFSELYGCYYHVVATILKAAHNQGISRANINTIVEQEAFTESGLHLIPRLLNGEWDLLQEGEDGLWRSKLAHAEPKRPVTSLQKSWLKAILQDKRIRLFLEDAQVQALAGWLQDVETLFRPEDFHTFDVALDGDNYEDEHYVQRFRRVLAAIKTQTPLTVDYQSGKGGELRQNIVPAQLVYSEKDDKFRLLAWTLRQRSHPSPVLLNMARITALHSSRREVPAWLRPGSVPRQYRKDTQEVTLYITKERNALERCMMQFAFYNKETEADEDGRGYVCRIRYNLGDEQELLIRILSFGPVVKVLGPNRFVALMQERVQKQFWCMEAMV